MEARTRGQQLGIALTAASLIAATGCSRADDPTVPIPSTTTEEAASSSPSPSALPEMTAEELRDFMVEGAWSTHPTLRDSGSYTLMVDADYEILTSGSPDYFDVLCTGPLTADATVRVTLECLGLNSDGTAFDAGKHEGTASLTDSAGLATYPESDVVILEWDDGRVDVLERRT